MHYYSNTVCVILLGGDTNLYDIKGYDFINTNDIQYSQIGVNTLQHNWTYNKTNKDNEIIATYNNTTIAGYTYFYTDFKTIIQKIKIKTIALKYYQIYYNFKTQLDIKLPCHFGLMTTIYTSGCWDTRTVYYRDYYDNSESTYGGTSVSINNKYTIAKLISLKHFINNFTLTIPYSMWYDFDRCGGKNSQTWWIYEDGKGYGYFNIANGDVSIKYDVTYY